MASGGPGTPPPTPWRDPSTQHVNFSFGISGFSSSEKGLPVRLSMCYSGTGVKKGRVQVAPGPAEVMASVLGSPGRRPTCLPGWRHPRMCLCTAVVLGVSPDDPRCPWWGQMGQRSYRQRLQNGKPPKSLGVRQSSLPTQRFRKPFKSGEPASPTSLALPLSVSFPRLL